MSAVILIAMVIIAVTVLLILLIVKNQRDKKNFTPGSTDDAVEETKADQHRNAGRT